MAERRKHIQESPSQFSDADDEQEEWEATEARFIPRRRSRRSSIDGGLQRVARALFSEEILEKISRQVPTWAMSYVADLGADLSQPGADTGAIPERGGAGGTQEAHKGAIPKPGRAWGTPGAHTGAIPKPGRAWGTPGAHTGAIPKVRIPRASREEAGTSGATAGTDLQERGGQFVAWDEAEIHLASAIHAAEQMGMEGEEDDVEGQTDDVEVEEQQEENDQATEAESAQSAMKRSTYDVAPAAKAAKPKEPKKMISKPKLFKPPKKETKEEIRARLARAKELGNIYMRQVHESADASASTKKKPTTTSEKTRKGQKKAPAGKDAKAADEKEETEEEKQLRLAREAYILDEKDRKVKWTLKREHIWKKALEKAIAGQEEFEAKKLARKQAYLAAKQRWWNKVDQYQRGYILSEEKEKVYKEAYAKALQEVEEFARMREQEIAEKERQRLEESRPRRRQWGIPARTQAEKIALRQAILESRVRLAQEFFTMDWQQRMAYLARESRRKIYREFSQETPGTDERKASLERAVDEYTRLGFRFSEPRTIYWRSDSEFGESQRPPVTAPRQKWFIPQTPQQYEDIRHLILAAPGSEYIEEQDAAEGGGQNSDDDDGVEWHIPEHYGGRAAILATRLLREPLYPPGEEPEEDPVTAILKLDAPPTEEEEEPEVEADEEEGAVELPSGQEGLAAWKQATSSKQPLFEPPE